MNMDTNSDNKNVKMLSSWTWILAAAILLLGIAGYLVYRSSHTGTLTRLSQVSGKRADTLAGKQAELKSVVVQLAGPDDFAFWVSQKSGGRDLLVYLNFDLQSKTHLANDSQRLKDGQQVSVSGVLKPLPQNIGELWKVNDNDAKLAADKGIYLEVSDLVLPK